MRTNQTIIVELQKIALRHSGLLRPEVIVESARPVSSPLHKYFTWDDTDAAQKYRLYEARALANAVVRWITLNGDRRPVRVFVSLTADRRRGGGYRDTVAVISNKDMRAEMLQDALEEMRRFEIKYSELKELSEVFAASKRVQSRLQKAWAA